MQKKKNHWIYVIDEYSRYLEQEKSTTVNKKKQQIDTPVKKSSIS